MADMFGIKVGDKVIAGNTTLVNAARVVDMINREYRTEDGGKPATLVVDGLLFNPKHEDVRDLLDGSELTRVRPRVPAGETKPPAKKPATRRTTGKR